MCFFQRAGIDFDFRHRLQAIRGAWPTAQGERGSASAHRAGGHWGHPVLARWGDTIPRPTDSTRSTSLTLFSAPRARQNSSTQGERKEAAEQVGAVLEARGHGQSPAGLVWGSPSPLLAGILQRETELSITTCPPRPPPFPFLSFSGHLAVTIGA